MSLQADIRAVELELGRTSSDRDYAMFTDLGNAAVHAIVEAARARQLNWAQTRRALSQLAESNEDVFGEATDTAVRECVYDALGFGNKGENFYGV